ncbi:hypothetical protein B566_EDAN016222 [Ephemera danica]|nr:hypothetical protein B566_EDAN016222 [Ephemera danica]
MKAAAMGGAEQQFCLRWNNHQSTLVSVFEALLESETLVDVTLAAEGRFLKAHKVVLCACSPFFQELLSSHLEKYPIIVLKDVTFQELKALIDYMYRGEVNVSQEQLAALIKTAESLKIKGLADGGSDKHKKQPSPPAATSSPVPPPPPPPPQQPPALAAEHRNSPVNNVREGSASPVSRKRRKRSRRRSGDSIEGSVESSLSEPPAGEVMDAEKERVIRALGLVPPSALLEPKAEEIEEEEEESVDLMLDEEHTSEGKDSERPGPSHEGLQSSGAGFPPWHVTPERGGGSQSGEDLSISVAGGDSGGSAGLENRGEKLRHVCVRCGRRYAVANSLRRHVGYECGVAPRFMCPLCQCRTRHKVHMLRHIRKQHPEFDLREDEIKPLRLEDEWQFDCYYNSSCSGLVLEDIISVGSCDSGGEKSVRRWDHEFSQC